MINCLCILQDKVLAYIIRKYISKTPFLIQSDWDSQIIESDYSSKIDLVIAELTRETEKDIDNLRTNLSERYFIFFNNSNFENFEKFQESHFLAKNLTYSDFIEALSLVIDNKTFDKIIN